MKSVIIGAGIAGITAAKTIKEIDKDAEVVVIGDEMFLPYKRYLLTELLCGLSAQDDLLFLPLELLNKLDIKLRIGETVKAIEPSKKLITLHHNETMHYDKLLIATGCIPSLGLTLRPYKNYIQNYYSLNDILVLKKRVPEIQKCIVFGKGVSCLDLISGLYNLGKQIIYITKGKRAHFGLKESEFKDTLHDFLEEKGIDIITEDRIVSIDTSKHGYRADTLRQKKITADIIFGWDHYNPNISCVENTSIEKRLGILVNAQLETSEKDIYAAGNCMEIYNPFLKKYWFNFGLPNALEQGRVAGKNMLGQEEEYKIHETITFNLMGKSLKARWWR
ncbi:MAG: FAD-dependent oxidoreductase [Candidatus Scalindua sp.]|nr:FAD-dependent oxidoreductase [Candidatus Scalindua sp.]